MTCSPITKKQQNPNSADIAQFLYPPNMVPHSAKKGLMWDEQAQRRLFAQEVIQRLVAGGWRCYWPSGEFEKYYALPPSDPQTVGGKEG